MCEETNIYIDGKYMKNNPTWDIEDSLWKAENVMRIMQRNNLVPRSVAEVGCGAGEILRQLYLAMPEDCTFGGWEISPQAIELCDQRKNERLEFHLGDILQDRATGAFDVMLALDVFEHVDDYLGFLRGLRAKAEHKIFHIPLDISVLSVFRMTPILEARARVGHLHYFCKETALASLEDSGYQIIDWFYTSGPESSSPRLMQGRSGVVEHVKRHVYKRKKDMWVRMLGGSMMVLAR